MVDIHRVHSYELLRRQLDERLTRLGPFAADEETERLDAELVELERRLPEGFRPPTEPGV